MAPLSVLSLRAIRANDIAIITIIIIVKPIDAAVASVLAANTSLC